MIICFKEMELSILSFGETKDKRSRPKQVKWRILPLAALTDVFDPQGSRSLDRVLKGSKIDPCSSIKKEKNKIFGPNVYFVIERTDDYRHRISARENEFMVKYPCLDPK